VRKSSGISKNPTNFGSSFFTALNNGGVSATISFLRTCGVSSCSRFAAPASLGSRRYPAFDCRRGADGGYCNTPLPCSKSEEVRILKEK